VFLFFTNLINTSENFLRVGSFSIDLNFMNDKKVQNLYNVDFFIFMGFQFHGFGCGVGPFDFM